MSLTQTAIDILARNDRGGFTIPTAGLYPYQWNWDSAFVALGIATYDMDRAWGEITSLIEGQWPDGMIPSILFRSDDPDYFPGPSRWGKTPGPIPSTGISQPPVLATVVRKLTQGGTVLDQTRRAQVFDAMFRWHAWWHDARTVDGIVATVHPWETGRDNCPEWNIGLQAMHVAPDLAPYTRMDNKHVDPDKDLRAMAASLDKPQAILDQIDAWIAKGDAATDTIWNSELGAFTARDLRTGTFSKGFSNCSALCFYADSGTDAQRSKTADHMTRIAAKVGYMLPSWDPEAADFEAQRYWCGPLWPQMNYMTALGLSEQGHPEMAARVQDDLCRAIEKSGFWECFNPLTGDGCVGNNFSWTAAVWLSWQTENKLKGAA